MARDLISTYVVAFPACSCRCCCSGPFASLSSIAILTACGSSVSLSCSCLVSWNSHVVKLSSNFCSSSCGLRNLVRYPTLLAPKWYGVSQCSSCHVSKPLPRMFCLQIVDAGPSRALTKMSFKLLLSCIHCSATACEGAAASRWPFATACCDCSDCPS